MDFIEAIKQMKEGKKVRRTKWENLSCFVTILSNDLLNIGNSHELFYQDYEATDWEIVDDDKDWNLAIHPKTYTGYEFCKSDVKKCRDLILEDINKIGAEYFGKETHKSPEISAYFTQARIIIKKRFGKL